jgi:uncharacterized protein YlxW (UPF0749 family)
MEMIDGFLDSPYEDAIKDSATNHKDFEELANEANDNHKSKKLRYFWFGSAHSTKRNRLTRIFLFFLIVVIAFASTISLFFLREAHSNTGKNGLISQIEKINSNLDEIGTENNSMESKINAIHLDSDKIKKMNDLFSASAMSAGVSSLKGQGVRLNIDDSSSVTKISYWDLQVILNQLFSSGAEAVSINSYRITNLSSIREGGSAIIVNYNEINSPFVIDSIGDPYNLKQGLYASSSGGALNSLSSSGVDISLQDSFGIKIPNAQVSLEYAKVVD